MSPFLSAIWQENLKKWQEEKSGRRTFLFLQRGVNGRNNILFKNVEAHNAVTHQKTVSLLKKKQDPLLSARPGKLQPVSQFGRGHSMFYLFFKKTNTEVNSPYTKSKKKDLSLNLPPNFWRLYRGMRCGRKSDSFFSPTFPRIFLLQNRLMSRKSTAKGKSQQKLSFCNGDFNGAKKGFLQKFGGKFGVLKSVHCSRSICSGNLLFFCLINPNQSFPSNYYYYTPGKKICSNPFPKPYPAKLFTHTDFGKKIGGSGFSSTCFKREW